MMKLKRAMLMLMSLAIVMITISAVSADRANDTFSESFSLDTSNDTVYLSDNVYYGHNITIDRSIKVIGSNNSCFDGKYQESLFTIENNACVTFENIQFANFENENNGAVFNIKKSCTVILINCTFTNNQMAINNIGNLEIYDSYFDNNSLTNQNSHGGAISNDGKLYIENTVFTNSFGPRYSKGATIYNNGDLTLNRTTISNAYAAEDSKGSALFNNNRCLMINSIIENNMIERYNFNYIHGAIYNQGNLTAIGNIFRNNSGKYVRPNTWYEGSPTIYNVGDINLTYNAFIDNVYFKGLSVDVFNNGARFISLENNWWQINDNPIKANKLNEGNTIKSWIVFDITPEYLALNINESALIKAGFKLNGGGEIQNGMFSKFNITLFDGDKHYSDSFLFNRTQQKSYYTITASVCNFTVTSIVDVGKIPVNVELTTNNTITFPDDVYIKFVSNVNQNITVTLNDKKYVVTIKDNVGNLTVRNLDAGIYDLSVAYEGDDDHFKAFNQTTVTVGKMQVSLVWSNVSDIMADEEMTATITLNPDVSPVWAQLFINGVFNKTIYLYDSQNNLTFKNLRQGSYNISVLIAQGENYFSANASETFNVGRYNPKLNVSVEDIRLGKNATVCISAHNFTGNAILSISGVNTTISISNDTNITIPNLEGGLYFISVIFNGNSLYLPSYSNTTFRVIKNEPEFDVNIERNDKKAKIYINANKNSTGSVGVYVNFEKYYKNLTDGGAVFDVDLDSGTNYVFVFYEGDKNFENATYNTTIVTDEEFTLVGSDVEGFEWNNFTYSIVLVEKNRITMPDCNVTIEFENQTYGVITDNNGTAGISLSLAAGEYVIKATYLDQTVTNSIIVRTIDYELKTSDVEFGEDAVLAATFEGNITGFIKFDINGTDYTISVNGSNAEFNISDLKIGNYTVSATYFNEIFTSKTVVSSFEVKKATPKFDVKTANISPGEDETIEISILNNFKGILTVNIDNNNYQININDSKVILKVKNLKIGVYEVLVSYGGNENFNSFTYLGKFSVRNQTSGIALNISNSYFGDDLTVNAILDKNASGKITFKVSDLIKTAEVINGQAKCIFSGLNAGTYRIDAQYGGDMNFASSDVYGFFRILKANSTIDIITDEVELGENIMIYAKLSPNATGEVYFSMLDYYSPRAKQISDGTAFWYISPLEAGRYTIIATYTGDANYNRANTTFTLKVSQLKSFLKLSVNDASCNDRVAVNVGLSDVDGNPISGKVTVSLKGKIYDIDVANGVGRLIIGKLNPGSYVLQAIYGGNEDYSTSSASGEFIVSENLLESNLTVGNVTAFYKGSQLLVMELNSNGKPIAMASVNVRVNGISYNVKTDNFGVATLDFDLNPGVYEAQIIFEETLSHRQSNASSLITVLSTINATDVVKLYGSGTQYFAVFYTSQGTALGNAEVSFVLNGKTYKVKTLPNGVVRLNINIEPGSYKITAVNPQTKQKVVNTVRIYAKIMENNDLKQYYGANKYFKVRIYNATTGKVVGSGVKVKFKINKKTYTVKTDKNGYASLKIKLKHGKYTITTAYDGYKVSNNIVVKPVLTAKNIVGKNVKKLKFKVKLVNKNGKALKGKKIKFKFVGKTYFAKTNAKGVASVTLSNLKIGKYKIFSGYGKIKIVNSIKIKK